MSRGRARRVRRRRGRIIRDQRGLPARRMPAHRAGRGFAQLLYWAKRNGISVITEAGKPAYVLLSPERYDALVRGLGATMAVAAVRARNPGGLFTLADEVFGTGPLADTWMTQGNERLAGRRPVDLLDTTQGREEVRNILQRILQGMFA
ncbi:MAG: hypothetical protein NVS9B11_12560 [Candidatus Dormibacteraceae bacterium]